MGLYEQHAMHTAVRPTFRSLTHTTKPRQHALQEQRRAEALTPQEIHAARRATYFDTGLWGSPEQGWSSEALVAQKRGVMFQKDVYGVYSPDDMRAAYQALEDVATFLGFSDIDAYLNAVMREQTAMIDRFAVPLS